MNSQPLHIARSGQPLGVFESDQVRDGLENGQLLRTDHYFDERRDEWIPLSAWRPPLGTMEFRKAEHRSDRPLPLEAGSPKSEPSAGRTPKNGRKGRSGRSSRSKKDRQAGRGGIAGWIACLFALGIAGGIWAWAESIRGELRGSEEKLRELASSYEFLKREKRLLSELTPPGRIRAVIVTTPGTVGTAVMSGATVALFRREDVLRVLVTVFGQGSNLGNIESRQQLVQLSDLFKRALPAPLEVTLADSTGSVDIPIPGEGEYVLFASAQRGGGDPDDRYYWLVGFDAGNFPSRTILLTESNSISIVRPIFEITDIDTMAAGNSKK